MLGWCLLCKEQFPLGDGGFNFLANPGLEIICSRISLGIFNLLVPKIPTYSGKKSWLAPGNMISIQTYPRFCSSHLGLKCFSNPACLPPGGLAWHRFKAAGRRPLPRQGGAGGADQDCPAQDDD